MREHRQNQIQAITIFLILFGAYLNTVFVNKVRIHELTKWLHMSLQLG